MHPYFGMHGICWHALQNIPPSDMCAPFLHYLVTLPYAPLTLESQLGPQNTTFPHHAVMYCPQVLAQRIAELERAERRIAELECVADPFGVTPMEAYSREPQVSLPLQQQPRAAAPWGEEGRCSGTHHRHSWSEEGRCSGNFLRRPSWGPLTLTVPQDVAGAAEPAVPNWPLMME